MGEGGGGGISMELDRNACAILAYDDSMYPPVLLVLFLCSVHISLNGPTLPVINAIDSGTQSLIPRIMSSHLAWNFSSYSSNLLIAESILSSTTADGFLPQSLAQRRASSQDSSTLTKPSE